jgi:hypothetical protein
MQPLAYRHSEGRKAILATRKANYTLPRTALCEAVRISYRILMV